MSEDNLKKRLMDQFTRMGEMAEDHKSIDEMMEDFRGWQKRDKKKP